MSRSRYLEKLKEKRVKDEMIKEEEKDLSSYVFGSYIDRISFNLVVYSWAPGVTVLGSRYNAMEETVYTLDEQDLEYFRKKFSTLEAKKEDEYSEKLKKLKQEYGKL